MSNVTRAGTIRVYCTGQKNHPFSRLYCAWVGYRMPWNATAKPCPWCGKPVCR